MKPLQQNFQMIPFTYQSFFLLKYIDTSNDLRGSNKLIVPRVKTTTRSLYIHLDMHHQLCEMDSLKT